MKKNITKILLIALLGMTVCACNGKFDKSLFGKSDNSHATDMVDDDDESGLDDSYGMEYLLQQSIEEVQKTLPQDLGDMVETQVYLDDNYLYTVFECNEDVYDMDQLKLGFKIGREEVIEEALDKDDPDIRVLVNMLKATNRGYVMKYIGKTSGKTAVLKIEASEL